MTHISSFLGVIKDVDELSIKR